MLVDASRGGRVGFASEKDSLAKVEAQLVPLFTCSASPERRGLYVASSNAGTSSALDFWRGALEKGVALANPERFPWTLANATGGALARAFEVMGPNGTFTGGPEALVGALGQASDDLDAGIVDVGFVLAIDFAQDASQETHFACIRAVAEASSATADPGVAPPAVERLHDAAAALPSALLDAWIEQLGPEATR